MSEIVLHPSKLTKLSNYRLSNGSIETVLHPSKLTKPQTSNLKLCRQGKSIVLHPFELTKPQTGHHRAIHFAKCCQFEDVSIMHKSLSIITHFSCSKL